MDVTIIKCNLVRLHLYLFLLDIWDVVAQLWQYLAVLVIIVLFFLFLLRAFLSLYYWIMVLWIFQGYWGPPPSKVVFPNPAAYGGNKRVRVRTGTVTTRRDSWYLTLSATTVATPPPLVVANYIFRPWCPSSNLWLIKWWVNTGGLDFKDNLITNFMSSNGVQQVWCQHRGGVLILYITMAAIVIKGLWHEICGHKQ